MINGKLLMNSGVPQTLPSIPSSAAPLNLASLLNCQLDGNCSPHRKLPFTKPQPV